MHRLHAQRMRRQTRRRGSAEKCYPEGPSTQYLRFLVPKTVKVSGFGTRNLKYGVLGPIGII